MSRRSEIVLICVISLSIAVVMSKAAAVSESTPKPRIVNVGIGEFCALGAAPVGPNGSWQVVEKDVEKICAKGTTCRSGACNCDNLSDGSIMGLDSDADGNRVCRKIAGQKCSADTECFEGVPCKDGVCTCDRSKNEWCVDKKNDAIILA